MPDALGDEVLVLNIYDGIRYNYCDTTVIILSHRRRHIYPCLTSVDESAGSPVVRSRKAGTKVISSSSDSSIAESARPLVSSSVTESVYIHYRCH